MWHAIIFLINDEEHDDGENDNNITHIKTMAFSTSSHDHLDGCLRFKAQVNNKNESIASSNMLSTKKYRKVTNMIVTKLVVFNCTDC